MGRSVRSHSNFHLSEGQVEQVVRTFTGRNEVQVLNIRKVVDKDGKARGYEVDIR